MERKRTILCLASYFKGLDFIKAVHAQGWRVLLVTSEEYRGADWPDEAIDEYYYMPGDKDQWDMKVLAQGLNGIVLKEYIDKIVALDDFDVERAATLREHLRVPGMGETRARLFRDKLAMRMMADEAEVPNPRFIAPYHPDTIQQFIETVPAPWILKPRGQASALGIKKFEDAESLWARLNELGGERVNFVLEQFIPGDVYHVDGVVFEGKVKFARAHKYMSTPFTVAHDGGLFRTHSLDGSDPIAKDLIRLNQAVMKGFGMKSGATHTEFLRAHEDGKYYFIETAARVGGANIAEMVEAGTGVNLWSEWAKIETLAPGETYKAPKARKDHSGIMISLAKQEWPDLSPYDDEEVVWKMKKRHHAGLIVTSPKLAQVIHRLDQYAERFYRDFFATMPAGDKPSA
jgi:biotin carboxylase